jgi:DnaD/phage-associated family protein
VLLALAAEPLCRMDLEAAKKSVGGRLSLSADEVGAAVAFWRGTGLIAFDDAEVSGAPGAPVEQKPQPLVIADKGLPAYSGSELSEVLERRGELAALIDECQRVFGKIFNTKEVAVVAGLLDYLGLDGEYILLLLSHCLSMEKKSLRYVEKMAITLHDEGIHDARILEERLHRIEVMASATGKIRTMFGISSRALTAKEKAMLENWLCTMQYGDDVLQRAYEITVDSIGKPSLPYANTILERWYAEGYRTIEDVDAAIADYKRKKNEGKGSFDVDDFFEAALARTYGEKT